MTTSVFGSTPAEVIVTVSDAEGAVGSRSISVGPAAARGRRQASAENDKYRRHHRQSPPRRHVLNEIDTADAEVAAEHGG